MSDVTIKQLAGVLGMGVDKLITQLAEAGMKFSSPEQVVSSTEKVKLLGFLRRTHGKTEKEAADNAPRQVTLKRRGVVMRKSPHGGAEHRRALQAPSRDRINSCVHKKVDRCFREQTKEVPYEM